MAACDVRAPGVVQNLNLANDLYGDRSNIRFPFDTGVQIYTCDGPDGLLTPQRTLNTHLLAGESEKRPEVGCDYTATFADSSFLPKGFATDSSYFAVTSVGISFVEFGLSLLATTGSNAQLTSGVLEADALAVGKMKGATPYLAGSGKIGAIFMRALLSGVYFEYLQDGRKSTFLFDSALSIPSGVGLNDQTSNGLAMPSNRLLLPVPFLLSPRNTNQSQEIVKVHFSNLNPVLDPTGLATASTGTPTAAGLAYAVKYKFDFGGYLCNEAGCPAQQNWSQANAAAAAEYRTVG